MPNLVEDSHKGYTAEQVPVFKSSPHATKWECPFCTSESLYKLPLPSQSQPKALQKIKGLIRQHIQLHQKSVVEELIKQNAFTDYEKKSDKDVKTTRQWIEGTIIDRGLYKDGDDE